MFVNFDFREPFTFASLPRRVGVSRLLFHVSPFAFAGHWILLRPSPLGAGGLLIEISRSIQPQIAQDPRLGTDSKVKRTV